MERGLVLSQPQFTDETTGVCLSVSVSVVVELDLLSGPLVPLKSHTGDQWRFRVTLGTCQL